MIGAAARFRKQQTGVPHGSKKPAHGDAKARRNSRSQSPGPRKGPNSLLNVKVSEGRRGSVNVLMNTTKDKETSGSHGRLSVPNMRKRSGSMPVIKFTLAVAWNIKQDHVRALKVTWSRLCDTPRSNCRGIVAIVDHVFDKFIAKEKTVMEVFYNTAFVNSMVSTGTPERRRSASQNIATLRDHIHFFVSLISQVIHSLEIAPQQIFEHIDKIGSYHFQLRKYGFKAAFFERLGELFVDSLVVQDCVRGFPEACKAWTILVAAIIDRLRSAPHHVSTTIVLRREFVRQSPSTANTEDSSPCGFFAQLRISPDF